MLIINKNYYNRNNKNLSILLNPKIYLSSYNSSKSFQMPNFSFYKLNKVSKIFYLNSFSAFLKTKKNFSNCTKQNFVVPQIREYENNNFIRFKKKSDFER